ncbi:hypothetical protein HYZ70_02995 [Candidatus Curtissbacteria bacterium]|nr:hypothetical protein [Candidatus Curtissbacteria bacterium]
MGRFPPAGGLPMDATQIVLLAVVIILAVFMVALGFQAFFVLRDARKTLVRMNKLFDDADDLVDQVRKPIASAGSFVTALIAGAGLTHLLKRGKEEKKK